MTPLLTLKTEEEATSQKTKAPLKAEEAKEASPGASRGNQCCQHLGLVLSQETHFGPDHI